MPHRRALAVLLGVIVLVWQLGPTTILAAAPDVREYTPADIAIDGSSADWDEPAADFLADMFEAGKPEKDSSRSCTAATTAPPRRSTFLSRPSRDGASCRRTTTIT